MGERGHRNWPLLRQLTGPDRLGRGAAARSRGTEQWRARTEDADTVTKSVCPFCAVGCGQRVFSSGRSGHPRRG